MHRQGWGLPRSRSRALFALGLLIVGLVAMHSMVTDGCALDRGHHAHVSAAGVAVGGPTQGLLSEGRPTASEASIADSCGHGAEHTCLAILLVLLALALLHRHVRVAEWSRAGAEPRERYVVVPDSALLLRLGVLRL